MEKNGLFDGLDYRFVRLPNNLRPTKTSRLVGLMSDLTEKSVLSCNIRDELENRDSLSRAISELFLLFSEKYRRAFYNEYIRCSLDAKFSEYQRMPLLRKINTMLALKVVFKKANLYQYSPLIIESASNVQLVNRIIRGQEALPQSVQYIIDNKLAYSLKVPPKADAMSGRVYVRDSEFAINKDKPFSWPQVIQAHYSVEPTVVEKLVEFFKIIHFSSIFGVN